MQRRRRLTNAPHGQNHISPGCLWHLRCPQPAHGMGSQIRANRKRRTLMGTKSKLKAAKKDVKKRKDQLKTAKKVLKKLK